MIINDFNINRYELIDNFMMTRLPKPSQTSVRPYELIENVSDGIYFFKYSYTIICFVCCFHDRKKNSVQERI